MPDSTNIPRLIVAGTASGAGKTTFTVGLARALRAKGLKAAVFKCGPDYLDPTYHARAAGEPCHNLDGWMMGRAAVLATFARAARGADLALIEGVMGLFDGASPAAEEGSTAEIAKWLKAPVILLADVSGMARTVAAIVHGCATFDPELQLAGLVCNRVGSRSHLEILREAVRSTPVMGGLPNDHALAFPQRHLGLHTADERTAPESVLAGWGKIVGQWCDLDAILAAARAAPPLAHQGWAEAPAWPAPRCRIGVAFDEAFHFYYEDNLRRLEFLGAELVRFSPIADARLPEVDGLYIGGGYPEAHAAALSANRPMRREIAAFAASGRTVYAECGGLMYLCAAIRTLEGQTYPMAGVLPAQAVMCGRLQALGYVEVETRRESPLGPAGLRFRGHQFRYSDLRPLSKPIDCAYQVRRRRDGQVVLEGYQARNTLASYVHAHWASNPGVASGLVEACTRHPPDIRSPDE